MVALAMGKFGSVKLVLLLSKSFILSVGRSNMTMIVRRDFETVISNRGQA